MFTIAYGNAFDGITLTGVFDSAEEADKVAQSSNLEYAITTIEGDKPALDFQRIRGCRFHQCGTSNKSFSAHELREFNAKTGKLLARAENSGCESYYVEVARWSHDRSRWEWYCFEKMLDVCFMDENDECIDIDDWDKAVAIAAYINNGHDDSKFIPNLPQWEG